MGAPSSPIDVVNMALDFVGEAPISSFDDKTATAQLCARHYDDVRQTILRKYVWNFAATRALITRDPVAPIFEFSDRYLLPPDFIRFVRLGGSTDINIQELFLINMKTHDIETTDQGKYLLLNYGGSPTAQVIYIRDVEDPRLWDTCFRKLVALNLALEIAYQLTKEKGRVDQLNQMLSLEIPDAASIDGQEVPPQRVQRSKAIAARKLGASSYGVASQYTVLP